MSRTEKAALVILPCPCCGGRAKFFADPDMPGRDFVCCQRDNCSVCGPYGLTKKKTIEAWNAMPRQSVWRKKPPTVPGWYWRKKGSKAPEIILISGMDEIDRFANSDDVWAGPIDMPIDAARGSRKPGWT